MSNAIAHLVLSRRHPGRVHELLAQAALLQARLDRFQVRLARLGDRGSGRAGQG